MNALLEGPTLIVDKPQSPPRPPDEPTAGGSGRWRATHTEPAENEGGAGWLRSLRASDGSSVLFRVPLRVNRTTDPDDRGVIAWIPYLRCAGSGGNLSDALADLGTEILNLRRQLEGGRPLAPDASELLRRLRRVIS